MQHSFYPAILGGEFITRKYQASDHSMKELNSGFTFSLSR